MTENRDNESKVLQAPLDPKTWGAGENATAEDKAGVANRSVGRDRP